MQPSGPVQILLAKLKRVKPNGRGWVALCPSHEDVNPSLSVTTGADGRCLVNCHAGCQPAAIVAAVGLKLSDLFADTGRPSKVAPMRDPRDRPRLIKTYDYTDEQGALLYQSCRLEPKSFRQRRPDGSGNWIYKLDDTRLVLYRLPEVIEAMQHERRVFVVEGEKDADALVAFGYCATTNPMGAGKWRESFSETLRGSNVVILPDNDDAGRSHAEQVAASLTAKGATVKVVVIPGLAAKGDVSDWLANQANTLDDLEQRIQETARWTSDPMEARHRTRWRLDELWENDSIMRPPPPIVPRLAWSGRSTLIASREKTGKSTLVGYMATQVTRGGVFLGETCELGDVLLVSLEENPGDTARRLRHFGADPKRLHLVVGFNRPPRERPQELDDHIDAVDPLLVIVDTLAAYSNGLADDDNSASQMTAVLQPITKIAHARGVALVLVHHARKTDGRSRGSTAITAGTDVVCEFWAPDEDADPTLRRMRSAGRVPVVPQYDLRFDGDTYRLESGESPLDQRIVEFIRHHPGTSIKNVRDMVKGRFEDISATIAKLVASQMVLNEGEGRVSRLHLPESGNRPGTQTEPTGNGVESFGGSRRGNNPVGVADRNERTDRRYERGGE